jgi:hypothetical protein
MLIVHRNLLIEDEHLIDQYELKTSIKSLSARCLDIVNKSDQLTPIYDRQYSSWLLFESELNAFRDQILVELEQRIEHIVNIDVEQFVDVDCLHQHVIDLRVRTRFRSIFIE